VIHGRGRGLTHVKVPALVGRDDGRVFMFTAALYYFVLAFGALLGYETVRFAWLVPYCGDRIAELSEAPIMFVATVVAARWVLSSEGLLLSRWRALAMGVIAAAMALGVEFGLVAPLLDMSTREYLEMRDPAAAMVYYATLALFALMPAALGGTRPRG
jgi:hypothetical protein